MRTVIAICSLALSVAGRAQDDPCPTYLPASVEAKLLPVVTARAEGNDERFRKAFKKLLEAKDADSMHARVTLMDYYVGEAPAEELVCAVALDGKKVEGLLALHSRCDVRPRNSNAPRDRALQLREHTKELLRDGNAKESCTYE